MTLIGGDDDHPRPQLTRERWTDLCGEWGFAYDDGDVGLIERWVDRPDVFDRSIAVPFPPESPASGIGDPAPHRVLWYRRTFAVPAAQREGERLLLHFGAVDYRARVWVNGRLVAEHAGGFTPFSADITDVLVEGEQVVVVRSEDDPQDLEQPRGKQDWEDVPHAIWYDRTSGIWQPVWLEPVPADRITEVRWTPDLDAGQLRMDVRFARADDRPLRLQVVLVARGEVLVDDEVHVRGGHVRRDFPFRLTDLALGGAAHLWSPETPNLIDARLRVLEVEVASGAPGAPGPPGAAGERTVVDEVASYTAMRSIAARGRRILLNGRPYFLRLVLSQAWWPESHLAAPSGDALREEVEHVRALGFNGVRLHQSVADPRFLAWCDRIGLLVWAEMPAAYEFSPRAVERVAREWTEVLARDANAPCVIAWVPVNESWGVPRLEGSAPQRDFVRSLYHLTKALDPTRLVIGNDGWEQIVTDVVTVHDYTPRAEVLRQRYGDTAAVEDTLRQTQPGYRSVLLPGVVWGDEPVVISEFGGLTYDERPGDQMVWQGYAVVSDPAELLERYRGFVDPLLDSPALAGFCYTQLTDVQQERNGLLNENRRPKADPAAIRAITRRPAAGVPADEIESFSYPRVPGIPDVPGVPGVPGVDEAG
jgi:beta-galactosidase/beta-glucuronidase